MELQLPETTLLRVFSFLDAFSLLQATQVNKHWNKVAESHHLWRNLCLRTWSLPSSCSLCLRLPTWKQFFLHHTRRQRRMGAAKPEDFVYKEGAGNLGIWNHMAYLSESYQPVEGRERSLLCTASSRRMLSAWDVQEMTNEAKISEMDSKQDQPWATSINDIIKLKQKFFIRPQKDLRKCLRELFTQGTVVWSSPVQQSNIKFLATLPQLCLAFTVDTEETVKVWDCQHEDALAELTRPRVSFSMEALLAKEDPFLMVGDSEGDICTLTVPGLEVVSIVNAFNHSVDLLHCSPDARWVLAGAIHQRILPQVFLAECLLRPGTRAGLLSVSLPVLGCCAACWALRRANRVVLMFRRVPSQKTGFATFDVTTERIGDTAVIQAHQVESFTLPVHMESPVWMGVSDGTVIVLDSGPQLLLLTISGLPLQRFHDHQLSICHLWVGPLYVLTTSMDNHLRLYMWEDKGHHPYLKSCCDLEHRRGDQTPSCYVSRAICDEASIVCVVSRNLESSVLVMYSLNMCYGT